jgi:hypothetical protein
MMSAEPQKTTKTELQVARSDFLDAVAEVEISLVLLERRLNLRPNNASLGQKTGRLQKIADETVRDEITKVLPDLVELNSLRTEIVHRPMRVAALHGSTKAVFIACPDEGESPPLARIITVAQFERLATRVKSVGKQIAEIRT